MWDVPQGKPALLPDTAYTARIYTDASEAPLHLAVDKDRFSWRTWASLSTSLSSRVWEGSSEKTELTSAVLSLVGQRETT